MKATSENIPDPADSRESGPIMSESESLNSLLLSASKYGRAEAVRILVGNRADCAACDEEGNTSLLIAVSRAHFDTVRVLLETEADINAVNFGGEGVLHLAFSNGHIRLGKYLIDSGAQLDIKTNDGLDWKEFAGNSGQDVEAIQAAFDLDMQLELFEKQMGPILSTKSKPHQRRISGTSKFVQELAQEIYPQVDPEFQVYITSHSTTQYHP